MAAISIFGKVNLFIFKENLITARYSHILRAQLIPYANFQFPYGWVMVQDDSPAHKREAKEVLLKYTLNWPAKSPDVMPIENV